VPLFQLFGPDALEYRLADSAARMVVTDAAGATKLEGLRQRLPTLLKGWSVDGGLGRRRSGRRWRGRPTAATPCRRWPTTRR
jgi:acetyl-CoA synthetase